MSSARDPPEAPLVDGKAMNDEYGAMTDEGETYETPRFELESGAVLEPAVVRYQTYGTLNARRDNAMVVCHALTGNASLHSWWGGMLGPGKLFDPERYFVICANILGSCYGTSGPTSINPRTGEPYGADFPDVTVRDTVKLHMQMVREGLGVRQVACVVGGSLGGMQTLEWAYMGGPKFVRAIIPMSCGPEHHPWQIGISETQRQAIYADPKWRGGHYPPDDPPRAGLSVARQIAMVSYRSHSAYSEKFGRKRVDDEDPGHRQRHFFDVEKYLRYQVGCCCHRGAQGGAPTRLSSHFTPSPTRNSLDPAGRKVHGALRPFVLRQGDPPHGHARPGSRTRGH